MTRAEKDAFRQIDNELGDLKNEIYRALRALESGRAALASGILRDVLGCNLRPARLVHLHQVEPRPAA